MERAGWHDVAALAPALEALARHTRHHRTSLAGAEAVEHVKEQLPESGNLVPGGTAKGLDEAWFLARQFLAVRTRWREGAQITGLFALQLHRGTISPILTRAQGIRPERAAQTCFLGLRLFASQPKSH